MLDVYIYTNYLWCDQAWGAYVCSALPEVASQKNAILFINYDETPYEEFKNRPEITCTDSYEIDEETGETINNGGCEINYNYIFENYSDKINTYKHTFKKVGSKYYWVSSQIM